MLVDPVIPVILVMEERIEIAKDMIWDDMGLEGVLVKTIVALTLGITN